MPLKGIRRKRWSERCDCRMYGATVWLLRLSRAFCVAPVSLEQRRHVYTVRVSRLYAVTSCIVMSIMGIMVFAAMSHDVYHAVNKTNQSLWIHSKSSIMMFVSRYLLFCALFIMCGFGGSARMERFINYFKRVKEIHINIAELEMKFKPEKLEKILFLKLVVGVISSFSACIIKIVASSYQARNNQKSLLIQIFYTPLNLETVVSFLLTMQIVLMITSVSWSFKSLNKCIRQLHDVFLKKGRQAGHKAAIVNNIHSLSEIYVSLIKLGTQVNAMEGRMIVILICNLIFRFMQYVYITFTSFLFKDKIPRFLIPGNISQDISIIIIIVMFVEACHTTHKEMKTTKVLISQILCCTESARDRVSEALTNFYMNTEPSDHVYMPLGMVEISRSFYLQLVGILISLFVYIHQFKLTD